MNHICTWFCADEKGHESIFPQTGQKSSSAAHQHIYWRCLLLFYATSKRFNTGEKHVFFTNVRELPVVDGRNTADILCDLNVEVVYTNFRYRTPKGYFGMFQNQFYEFSILEYIVGHNTRQGDQYLILDSDCIFLHPVDSLFKEAEVQGFMSFEDDCTTDLVIHGLSRRDMKALYEDLLQRPVSEIPGYHLGEFFLASVSNINLIFADFLVLWPELLRRFGAGQPKFNEEAHTLSYIYYKNGLLASPKRTIMKRIWTNPVFYRNVEKTDPDLAIWHLPSEKTYGLADLYEVIVRDSPDYSLSLDDAAYRQTVQAKLGIPNLTLSRRLKYYVLSYSRALTKRIRKVPVVRQLAASFNPEFS